LTAEAVGTVQAVGSDLEAVGRALEGSSELRLLMASPVVRPGRKAAILKELFGQRVGTIVLEFLLLLVKKSRETMVRGIIEQYRLLCDQQAGVVDVQVTSALPLGAQEEDALKGQLERYTQKTVRLRLDVDSAIRGGLVIRIGDRVLDASVARQLELLHARLCEGPLHAQ